jgi:hypothetical protein
VGWIQNGNRPHDWLKILCVTTVMHKAKPIADFGNKSLDLTLQLTCSTNASILFCC